MSAPSGARVRMPSSIRYEHILRRSKFDTKSTQGVRMQKKKVRLSRVIGSCHRQLRFDFGQSEWYDIRFSIGAR